MYLFIQQVISLDLVHTYKYLCYSGPYLVLVHAYVSVYTAGDPVVLASICVPVYITGEPFDFSVYVSVSILSTGEPFGFSVCTYASAYMGWGGWVIWFWCKYLYLYYR